jgi:hypothetical protein
MPLTRLQIEHVKPQAKPYKVFDARGLYLEVAPAGACRWRFKYRISTRDRDQLAKRNAD